MNADVYDAWVNAGIKLHSAAAWLAAHWTGLAAYGAAIGLLAVVVWACRDGDYRSRNDAVAAQRITRFEERPEPGEPGSDSGLLEQCNAAYYGPTSQRKEDTP